MQGLFFARFYTGARILVHIIFPKGRFCFMIINLEEATLDDVAKNYQDVIKEACANKSYSDNLRDLISDCIGNDNISTILAFPNAFIALENNGFVAWNNLVLDVESNIERLIAAGYGRSDVLSAIADDIFYGSQYSDESPSHLCDVFEKYGSSRVKTIIQNNHPNINDAYLDEIVDNIGDFCDEMLSLRKFLAE